MREGGDPAIRTYIRANLATHTREAIFAALTAAGHEHGQIDAIWRDEWQAVGVERAATGLRWLSVTLLVLGGLIGAFGALLIIGFNRPDNGPVFLFLYGLSYVAIGYAIILLVGWSVRRFHLSGWWASLLGLALIPTYAILMYGACFATASITVVQ
jgi:drug/metabolite transporter (DMT)-like permease